MNAATASVATSEPSRADGIVALGRDTPPRSTADEAEDEADDRDDEEFMGSGALATPRAGAGAEDGEGADVDEVDAEAGPGEGDPATNPRSFFDQLREVGEGITVARSSAMGSLEDWNSGSETDAWPDVEDILPGGEDGGDIGVATVHVASEGCEAPGRGGRPAPASLLSEPARLPRPAPSSSAPEPLLRPVPVPDARPSPAALKAIPVIGPECPPRATDRRWCGACGSSRGPSVRLGPGSTCTVVSRGRAKRAASRRGNGA